MDDTLEPKPIKAGRLSNLMYAVAWVLDGAGLMAAADERNGFWGIAAVLGALGLRLTADSVAPRIPGSTGAEIVQVVYKASLVCDGVVIFMELFHHSSWCSVTACMTAIGLRLVAEILQTLHS